MRAVKLGTAVLLLVVSMSGCQDRPASPAEPELTSANHAAAASLSQAIPDDIGVSQGFSVELLSGLSSFPDDIAASFRIKVDGRATTVANVRDASLVVFLEATFAEGGSNGWHTHPSPGMFAVTSGRLGLINASDCVVRIYEAGQAFMDPGQGNVHVAFNALPEGEGETAIVGGFIGVPPGEPVSTPAADPGC